MGVRLGLTTDMLPLNEIRPEVHVIASLLVDPTGRVREGVSSRSLSSPEDRQRFLSLRQWAECIVIGAKTHQAESYERTRLPVIVYSRTKRVVDDWAAELNKLKGEYGDRILIEAGPGILHQLIREGLIDRLYLTRTSRVSQDRESPIFDLSLLGPGHDLRLIESTIVRSVDESEDLFETYERSGLT